MVASIDVGGGKIKEYGRVDIWEHQGDGEGWWRREDGGDREIDKDGGVDR